MSLQTSAKLCLALCFLEAMETLRSFENPKYWVSWNWNLSWDNLNNNSIYSSCLKVYVYILLSYIFLYRRPNGTMVRPLVCKLEGQGFESHPCWCQMQMGNVLSGACQYRDLAVVVHGLLVAINSSHGICQKQLLKIWRSNDLAVFHGTRPYTGH